VDLPTKQRRKGSEMGTSGSRLVWARGRAKGQETDERRSEGVKRTGTYIHMLEAGKKKGGWMLGSKYR